MDQNKAVKLHEIEYAMQPTCRLCKFSMLNGDWGTCINNTYYHDKHKEVRLLSVHASGWCPEFTLGGRQAVEIHGFKEFLAS